jgi:hypothetical protein
MQGNCPRDPQPVPDGDNALLPLFPHQCVLTTNGGVFSITSAMPGQKALLKNLYLRADAGPQQSLNYNVMVFAKQQAGAVWVEDVVFQGNWYDSVGGNWNGLWTNFGTTTRLHISGAYATPQQSATLNVSCPL